MLTPLSAAAESAAESTADSAAGSSFAETDSSYKTISKSRYIAGGLLSVFLGFGFGHDIQGRGSEKTGSIGKSEAFWKLQTINLLGGAWMLWLNRIEEPDEKVYKGAAIAFFSLFVFARLVEIWDAWTLPSHYKIVSKPFQLNPLVYYDGKSQDLSAGLSLKYRF